jgi:rhodanese-related sulfurtransferase
VVSIVAALIAAWLIWKYVQRWRFIRGLRMDRITPEELRRTLEAGEPIAVVDLRHQLDFEADPRTLPGALRFDAPELAHRHGEIPRDRDVVLYCT